MVIQIVSKFLFDVSIRPGKEIIMEEIEKLLKAIHRTAEIVHEHLEARGYRNHLTHLGIEGIMQMSKEAIEMVEKVKKAE